MVDGFPRALREDGARAQELVKILAGAAASSAARDDGRTTGSPALRSTGRAREAVAKVSDGGRGRSAAHGNSSTSCREWVTRAYLEPSDDSAQERERVRADRSSRKPSAAPRSRGDARRGGRLRRSRTARHEAGREDAHSTSRRPGSRSEATRVVREGAVREDPRATPRRARSSRSWGASRRGLRARLFCATLVSRTSTGVLKVRERAARLSQAAGLSGRAPTRRTYRALRCIRSGPEAQTPASRPRGVRGGVSQQGHDRGRRRTPEPSEDREGGVVLRASQTTNWAIGSNSRFFFTGSMKKRSQGNDDRLAYVSSSTRAEARARGARSLVAESSGTSSSNYSPRDEQAYRSQGRGGRPARVPTASQLRVEGARRRSAARARTRREPRARSTSPETARPADLAKDDAGATVDQDARNANRARPREEVAGSPTAAHGLGRGDSARDPRARAYSRRYQAYPLGSRFANADRSARERRRDRRW